MPPDTLAREYSLLAERYDTRWAHYIRATCQRTLAQVRLRASDRVLDVGCGTGVMLAELQRRNDAARLVGIDLVPQMLDVARRRLPAAVALHLAAADRLPFDDASFDIVLSASVFHYLSDPGAALREWTRVVRPGGQLVITDWCADYLTIRILHRYLRRFRPAHQRAWRVDEMTRWLSGAGCRVDTIEKYKIDWLWGLMTISASAAPAARKDVESGGSDPTAADQR